MVHVSSDRASPRLPAAALPPPLLLQNADGTETEELRRIYFKDKG